MIQIAQVLKSNGTDGEVLMGFRNIDPDDINLQEPVFIYFDGLPVPFFIEKLTPRGVSKALCRLTGIRSLADADRAFGQYGVDAVMIGRATFGCPWIFSRKKLTLDEKIDVLEEQLRINIERIAAANGRSVPERDDELRGILHTRRHLAATPVFKGIPNFRETRIQMLRAEKKDDLLAILEKCRETLK